MGPAPVTGRPALWVLLLVLGGTMVWAVLNRPDHRQKASQAEAMMVQRLGLGDLTLALSQYHRDHEGLWPASLEDLVPHYILEIPLERPGGTNSSVAEFDGSGGWVYDPDSGKVLPNTAPKP